MFSGLSQSRPPPPASSCARNCRSGWLAECLNHKVSAGRPRTSTHHMSAARAAARPPSPMSLGSLASPGGPCRGRSQARSRSARTRARHARDGAAGCAPIAPRSSSQRPLAIGLLAHDFARENHFERDTILGGSTSSYTVTLLNDSHREGRRLGSCGRPLPTPNHQWPGSSSGRRLSPTASQCHHDFLFHVELHEQRACCHRRRRRGRGHAAASCRLLELRHATVHHIARASGSEPAPGALRMAPEALEEAGQRSGAASRRLDGADLDQAGEALVREPRVTAVDRRDDEMALGLMAALHAAGRNMPSNVSIHQFSTTCP